MDWLLAVSMREISEFGVRTRDFMENTSMFRGQWSDALVPQRNNFCINSENMANRKFFFYRNNYLWCRYNALTRIYPDLNMAQAIRSGSGGSGVGLGSCRESQSSPKIWRWTRKKSGSSAAPRAEEAGDMFCTRLGPRSEGLFDPTTWVSPKLSNDYSRFVRTYDNYKLSMKSRRRRRRSHASARRKWKDPEICSAFCGIGQCVLLLFFG